MGNRFFSLVIVPDNSSEIKQSRFTSQIVKYGFCSLAAVFLICSFFIIGFHIKLIQEKEFKHAVQTREEMLARLDSSKALIGKLTDQLNVIRRNDIAYRKFAYMNIPDATMYRAGVGGHVIVDTEKLAVLPEKMRADVTDLKVEEVSLTNMVAVQEKASQETWIQTLRNNDEKNATPFMLPTQSFRITENYGWRIHPVTGAHEFHDAVDIGGNRGQRIMATADGIVTTAKYWGALGRCVVIQHKYGYETTYGHLNEIYVTEGQRVKRGETIGTMGSTGRATGVHVHYAVSHFGKKDNPKKYF
jgi:murein DD-endopeptidase MepM/ murein hydrolase activator NlpD